MCHLLLRRKAFKLFTSELKKKITKIEKWTGMISVYARVVHTEIQQI
jgi:hypothetical protein